MNVPQLRFKGFNEEWQSKKLKNVADVIGGGTPNTANNEYWNGNINWFVPSEVINKKYVNTSQRKITNKGLKNSSAKLLPINTILFTSRATIGSMAILKQVATTNQGFQSLVINRDNDVNYIYAMQNIIAKQAKQKAAGSTFLEISNKSVKSINVQVPSLPEQQKIGTFFSKLDDLITKQTQKVALLKQLKRGYLQKLFPQAGQTTPQLRFKGFNDEWQSKELKYFLNKNSERNKDKKFYNVESISNKYGFIKQNEYFENRNIASNDLSNYLVIHKGAFAYNPSRINVGSIALKQKDNISIISPLYISFYVKNNLLNDMYLWYLLKTNEFEHQRIINTQGGVRNTLNFNDLINIKISFPLLDEQQRIATLFAKLDHLIDLQNHKLQLLQELKKGYLQKMFI